MQKVRKVTVIVNTFLEAGLLHGFSVSHRLLHLPSYRNARAGVFFAFLFPYILALIGPWILSIWTFEYSLQPQKSRVFSLLDSRSFPIEGSVGSFSSLSIMFVPACFCQLAYPKPRVSLCHAPYLWYFLTCPRTNQILESGFKASTTWPQAFFSKICFYFFCVSPVCSYPRRPEEEARKQTKDLQCIFSKLLCCQWWWS